jgi:hypothetical protein
MLTVLGTWLRDLWLRYYVYIIGIMIGIVCVIALDMFVPATRPALTWMLGAVKTIAEILFWLLSLPAKLFTHGV